MIQAMVWVFNQDIRPSQLKFVLLALADNVGNENGVAWPSVKEICRKTSQDRKTVISALAKLEQRGFIEDTGERKGVTKQVKVYRVLFQNEEFRMRDCSKSSEFPAKESRISLERVPSTGHGTVKEPPVTQSTCTVEDIYDAYPLKVGRPSAINAIRGALKKKISPTRLLQLTKEYAEVIGKRREFVPHPSTWYNQERYNDDKETWDKKHKATDRLSVINANNQNRSAVSQY